MNFCLLLKGKDNTITTNMFTSFQLNIIIEDSIRFGQGYGHGSTLTPRINIIVRVVQY